MTGEKPKSPNRIIPNAYQSPNFYVDDLLPLLTGEEWKCMSFLIRKTLGWQKFTDRLAKSVISKATGMGEATVDRCMANLINFGLALRVNEDNGNHAGVEYGVQMNDELINWTALEERKTRLAEINVRRTEAARNARKKADLTPDVPHTGYVPQPPSPAVGHTPSPAVPQGTQKPIKANLNLGGKTPPSAWGIGWQLAAGVEHVELPSQEDELEARVVNACDLFPQEHRELVRAFVLATGIFPIKSDVSGWCRAFRDQQGRTGLAPVDITEACRKMLTDKLTIKGPFSVVGTAGSLHATNAQKAAKDDRAANAEPEPLQTPFAAVAENWQPPVNRPRPNLATRHA